MCTLRVVIVQLAHLRDRHFFVASQVVLAYVEVVSHIAESVPRIEHDKLALETAIGTPAMSPPLCLGETM